MQSTWSRDECGFSAHLGSNFIFSCGSRPGAGDLDEGLNRLIDVASIDVRVDNKLEKLARRERGDSCAIEVGIDMRGILPQKVQGSGVIQIH